MKKMTSGLLAPALVLALTSGSAVAMSDQDDACINHLRQVGGPDGQSGVVLSSSFSEAGTLVMLQDKGGTIWRCIAYADGAIGDFAVEQAADDGSGAVADAQADSGATTEERVSFASGTSGAELKGSLQPGQTHRYVLGAKDGQFLYFRLAADMAGMSYQIYNPDGSILLDIMGADKEYRGQLWQSGDHVIEVINRSASAEPYAAIFGIE